MCLKLNSGEMQPVHSCVCPAVLTVQRIEKEFKSRIITMDVFVVVDV